MLWFVIPTDILAHLLNIYPLAGFISRYEPHHDLYALEDVVPTLHSLSLLCNPVATLYQLITISFFPPLAVDKHDHIVPARKTEELQELFKNSTLLTHNEGKLVMQTLSTSQDANCCGHRSCHSASRAVAPDYEEFHS